MDSICENCGYGWMGLRCRDARRMRKGDSLFGKFSIDGWSGVGWDPCGSLLGRLSSGILY